MTKDEALNLALDFITESNRSSQFWLVPASNLNKTVTAIREALAQPEQEPVAYLDEGLGAFYWAKDYKKHVGFKPLYTTQPHRKPLTDEEVGKLWDGHVVPVFGKNGINPIVFARAIEAAHGIKEDA